MEFLDAIHHHVRSEGQIVKKTDYIAIAVNLDGRKDILGMWVGENESAKFQTMKSPFCYSAMLCALPATPKLL